MSEIKQQLRRLWREGSSVPSGQLLLGIKRSIDYPLIDAEINVLGYIANIGSSAKWRSKENCDFVFSGYFWWVKTMPIKEDHPVEPISPYGCTKLCEEKLSLTYAKLYAIEAVCLRYFNVYGPNQRFDAYEMLFPFLYFVCFVMNRFIFMEMGNKPETLSM